MIQMLATPSAMNQLVEALDAGGYRLTEPRLAVAAMIAEREGHFTAAELVAEARRRHPGLGRATVFRALDLFASLSVVERVDLPAGDHAYVACERSHHHHAICTSCGRSVSRFPTSSSHARASTIRISKRLLSTTTGARASST